MLRLVLSLLLALLAARPVEAQVQTPVGVWFHENGRIQLQIAPCQDRLCGKLVWFRWPNDAQGRPLTDLLNSDRTLRARPLLGLTVLRDLRDVGGGVWEDGKIYNPDDGKNYDAIITMQEDGAMRIRAYVLLPILGETLIWTRSRVIRAPN